MGISKHTKKCLKLQKMERQSNIDHTCSNKILSLSNVSVAHTHFS